MEEPMKGNWQASLLITDEPSNFENQTGRAYVLHTQPDYTIRGYCITRPFMWRKTDDWARRTDLCRHYDVAFDSWDGKDPLVSYGGDNDKDTVNIIYDPSTCWTDEPIIYESSKTISQDTLCVAQLEHALAHILNTQKWPAFSTIVIGYTEFVNEEIYENVASGKWQSRSLLSYPFVVFAGEMTHKVDVAKNVLRSYDGNTFSLMGHMLPIFDELRIAGIKYAVRKKAGNDTTQDEIEKITRLMLHLESDKERNFFNLEHRDWQKNLEEFRNLNIGGTVFDGLKRTPLVDRYLELEDAYAKLGFDPTMMELGLLMKAAGKQSKVDEPNNAKRRDDFTKWGQAVDMLKAVVKGQPSDPD